MNSVAMRRKNEEFIKMINEYVSLIEDKIKKYYKIFDEDDIGEIKSEELAEHSNALNKVVVECNTYRQNYYAEYKLYNQAFFNKNVNVAYNIETYLRSRAINPEVNKFMNKSQLKIQTCMQNLQASEQILPWQGIFINVDYLSDTGRAFVYLRQIQYYVQHILQFNDEMRAQCKILDYLNCELEDNDTNVDNVLADSLSP